MSFDSYEYGKQLEQAGVPEQQARVHARVLMQIIDQRLITRESMDHRLGELERRFDQRFDGIDQQLADINPRFVQVEQRFGEMKQQLGSVEQRLISSEHLISEIDRRFGAMEQRINDIDRHVGLLDKRIASIDHRILALQRHMLVTATICTAVLGTLITILAFFAR